MKGGSPALQHPELLSRSTMRLHGLPTKGPAPQGKVMQALAPSSSAAAPLQSARAAVHAAHSKPWGSTRSGRLAASYERDQDPDFPEVEDEDDMEDIDLEELGDVTFTEGDVDEGLPVWQEYLMSNVHGQLDSKPAAAQEEAAQEEAELSPESVEKLLAELPGVQRLIARRAAAAERDPESISTGEALLLAAPEALDEWDLRAIMEKRRRRERAQAAWLRERAKVGRATVLGADWRTDVRCRDTGDPTDPTYMEWTNRQIWDLVTMGGKGADPRSVRVRVEDPRQRADLVADGAQYKPEMHEWLAGLGRIIDEEEEAAITDKDGEGALLAAEFSDFDDDYSLPAGMGEGTDYIDAGSFDDGFGGAADVF